MFEPFGDRLDVESAIPGAGVGERGACAWTKNGLSVIKQVIKMSTMYRSFRPDSTEQRMIDKMAAFSVTFFFPFCGAYCLVKAVI